MVGAVVSTVKAKGPALVVAPLTVVLALRLCGPSAKAAGVKLHTLDVLSGTAFELASGERVETDSARGFSDTGGTSGGRLAGVLA
jgi:hypothetical protein